MKNELNLAPIKKQVSSIIKSAGSLKINSAPGLVEATDILGKIKSVGREIKEKRDSIIKPLNEAKNNAMDLFRPLESDWSEAERIVKKKMTIFGDQQAEKAREKEVEITEKIESGKMDIEKGAEKLDKIVPANKVEADNGSIQFRMVKKVVIENEFDVPRDFLILDMVKIRRSALAGFIIPGVKVVEEREVSSYQK